MAKTIELKVTTRTATGKEAAHATRHLGEIPGIYYGFETEPVKFTVNRRNLENTLRQEPRIIHLVTEKQDLGDCIVRELQKDPVTDLLLHIDFLALHPGSLVTVNVPIEFIGEPAALKTGGLLNILKHRLSIRCLPKDLPDTLKLDISQMEDESGILVRDVDFDDIEIKDPGDATIVRVTVPDAVDLPEDAVAEEELAEGETAEGAEAEDGSSADDSKKTEE
jgi:large subunit ribosomal protein L25